MAKPYGYKYKNTSQYLHVKKRTEKNKVAFEKSYWFKEYVNKEIINP